MTKEKFIFHIDTETRTKLESLSSKYGYSMSEVVRGLILNAYERETDTVRVPVVGHISNGKVFVDDAGAAYVTEQTEGE